MKKTAVNNKTGYRKHYQDLVGCSIPKYFDVHHLDLNRSNNNMDNLVAIPRTLHKEYHKLLNNYNQIDVQLHLTSYISSWGDSSYYTDKCVIESLTKLLECKKQIEVYITHKFYKMGNPFYKSNLDCY